MKRCTRCSEFKPRTEFYSHPKSADGLLGKCKPCQRADVRANRLVKIEHYRAYDRARGSRQELSYHRGYIAEHPNRRRANNAVSNAVRDGRLTKPQACWHCGSTRGVVAHHPDYSRPLAVSWMCQACHKRTHAETERANATTTRP